MMEEQIRSEILSRLAGLYEDPLTRTQHTLFTYEDGDGLLAQRLISDLKRQGAVEEKRPSVLRLTKTGYKLYLDTVAPARSGRGLD